MALYGWRNKDLYQLRIEYLQSPNEGGMERVEDGDLLKSMQNKKTV